MTLVVGLGNVGNEYKNTRHNVGFMLIDLVLSDLPHSTVSNTKFKGELFKTELGLFLKPSTFMNASGVSVLAVKEYYKCDKLIVIHDDIDLNLGTLRFKKGGSSGGHNGLKSIDALCGSEYERVRVGIGRGENVFSYVLAKFSADELEKLAPILENAKKALFALLQGESIATVSNLFSSKADLR